MSNAAFNENANGTSPNIATPGGNPPKKPKHMMLSTFCSIMGFVRSHWCRDSSDRCIGRTGQSMEPTFHNGDVVASRESEIIIRKVCVLALTSAMRTVKSLNDALSGLWLRRGTWLQWHKDTCELFVNGKSLFVPELPIDPAEITETPVIVPSGYVFAVGDNYNHSMDSRYSAIGLVPEKEIVGKVVVQISKTEGLVIVDQTPHDGNE